MTSRSPQEITPLAESDQQRAAVEKFLTDESSR